MVNLDYLRSIRDNEVSPINDGDHVPPEVCDYLRSLSPEMIRGLVNPGDKNPRDVVLKVEYICPMCQKHTVKKTWHITTLSRIGSIMSSPGDNDLCDECRRKIRAEALRPASAYQFINELKYDDLPCSGEEDGSAMPPAFLEATAYQEGLVDASSFPPSTYFIRTFLDPGKKLVIRDNDDPERLAARVAAWAEAAEAEAPGAIMNHIRQMQYKDFLQTPYWKLVAARAKHRAGYRCSMCQKDENLAAHHRSYAHHGAEIFYPEDITCVCKECHTTFHNLFPKR